MEWNGTHIGNHGSDYRAEANDDTQTSCSHGGDISIPEDNDAAGAKRHMATNIFPDDLRANGPV